MTRLPFSQLNLHNFPVHLPTRCPGSQNHFVSLSKICRVKEASKWPLFCLPLYILGVSEDLKVIDNKAA